MLRALRWISDSPGASIMNQTCRGQAPSEQSCNGGIDMTDDNFPEGVRWALGAFAHRISNDLAIASLLVDRAQHQPMPDVAGLLSEIGQRLTTAKAAINEMLDTVSEWRAPNVTEVDVNDAVEAAKQYATTSLPGLTIRLELSPVPLAHADERLLREILVELLRNAEKARAMKAVIQTRPTDAGIEIDVIDDGEGMTPQALKRLGSVQVSGSERANQAHGLFLAFAMARLWGASLDVVRSDSSGTTIRILLRAAFLDHLGLEPGKTALVIDDEPLWRDILGRTLTDKGLTVEVASDEASARELIVTKQYDYVMLDLRLTGLEFDDSAGIELLEAVHEYSPEALTVIVTGYATIPMVQRALASGVGFVFEKANFNPNSLSRAITGAALRREEQRELFRSRQLDPIMSETLAIISHELRSPLVTIRRSVEALRLSPNGRFTRLQRQLLESIQLASEHELRLLNAHLDLNRIRTGSEKLNYEEHDIPDLIREEVALHKLHADRGGISIQVDAPHEVPPVRVDAERLRIALNPLIENAIRFSKQGDSIPIAVQVTDRYVQVLIEDHGPGIDAAEFDALMNVNGRLRGQRIRGTGLGLLLAKRAIEFNGGDLWVERSSSKGTTIGFRLPLFGVRDENANPSS